MKIGNYFRDFAAKTLTPVDISPARSNQSEIGGTDGFRAMLGTPAEPVYYQGYYVYLDDESAEAPEIVEATVTWYDPRRNDPKKPAEYRLLYRAKARPVISRVDPGDTLFIARRGERELFMIFAKAGSTILRQLEWLFGLAPRDGMLVGKQGHDQPDLEPISVEELLGLLDIEVDISDDSLLDRFPKSFFGDKWPTGAQMAALARHVAGETDSVGDPDATLLTWVRMETRLFQTLERVRISEDIARGFELAGGGADVDAFLKLSLSVQNRRKSRAGGSLELHMEKLLVDNAISYSRQSKTEGNKKPDFVFPSHADYANPTFPASRLTMLGAKTTLKDRWRQILNEANRIESKHLLTLQPGISEDQTNEMKAERIQLVIPQGLHGQGFSETQQDWLLNVAEFLGELRARRAASN